MDSPNKQYLFASLTESVSCVLRCSKQCCYRTFGLINEDMPLAEVAFYIAVSEARIPGHP